MHIVFARQNSKPNTSNRRIEKMLDRGFSFQEALLSSNALECLNKYEKVNGGSRNESN